MEWATGALEDLLYRLISPILLCKCKLPQKQVALSTSLLSDEEIVKLADSSPNVDMATYIVLDTGHPNPGHVAKIASDAVVKHSFGTPMHERLSAEFVRKYTAIPVPMHERVFRGRYDTYLVQQYIPGRVLLDVWSQLGWWRRLRAIITLRFYIHELRCISSRAGPPPFPGPPSNDGTPQLCTGRLFNEDGSGPFYSYQEMSKWYRKQLLFMQRQWKVGLDSGPFDDSVPLVFTHMDLHPRNIILGDDDQLWIVDWSDAGWYPSWFEATSMLGFAKARPEIPSSWTTWVPFMVGSCEKPGQLPFIRAISYSLHVLDANTVNLVPTNRYRNKWRSSTFIVFMLYNSIHLR
ncbi:hypothetical protein ACEPAI_1464 [Sanghuangporus weigelae]